MLPQAILSIISQIQDKQDQMVFLGEFIEKVDFNNGSRQRKHTKPQCVQRAKLIFLRSFSPPEFLNL